MFYKKPSNVSYVDMAIYIDGNIRNKDRQVQERCFEYMWHLFYILAVKRKFFSSLRDYEEYALFGATRLYLRYEGDSHNVEGGLPPIKSCLNYIKKVLYPTKVKYQKAFFEEVISTNVTSEDSIIQLQNIGKGLIRRSTAGLLEVEFSYYLTTICSTIQGYLKSSPYVRDRAMLHNIYLSCVLTFLKSITISNRNKEKLESKQSRCLPIDSLLESIYYEESQDSVVLFHLDSSMENYIKTLVVGIKKAVAKDLRMIIGSFEPTEQVMRDILMSPTGSYGNEQYNSTGVK